jgi:DNA-binding MarR family transcriptional regulator
MPKQSTKHSTTDQMETNQLSLTMLDSHDPELTVLEIVQQSSKSGVRTQDQPHTSIKSPTQGQPHTQTKEQSPTNDEPRTPTNHEASTNADHRSRTKDGPRTSTKNQNAYPAIDTCSQRSIAKTLNLSLGMTNAIIKRLAEKGWVTIHKINGRNLRYSLTPEGTREVARRTYRYLRRTMGQVGRWKEKIEVYMRELKAQGYTRVHLVGESDLDFILEHCAIKAGMEWEQGQQLDNTQEPGTTLVLVGSGVDDSTKKDTLDRSKTVKKIEDVLVKILQV